MTNRQSTDDGRWFDLDKSEQFDEDAIFENGNSISVATGSEWDHESLYRTASGNWVLNCYSQRQGSRETWTTIDHTDGVKWMVENRHIEDLKDDDRIGAEV